MKFTRTRFRLAEMIVGPIALIIVDGLIHLSEGRPFMTEFLAGAACAVMILRGFDAYRAHLNVWPEVE